MKREKEKQPKYESHITSSPALTSIVLARYVNVNSVWQAWVLTYHILETIGLCRKSSRFGSHLAQALLVKPARPDPWLVKWLRFICAAGRHAAGSHKEP